MREHEIQRHQTHYQGHSDSFIFVVVLLLQAPAMITFRLGDETEAETQPTAQSVIT